ncbi:hypothetical protein BRO54_0684 [Geobacillus proteiniphilus]|uniref:Uncharacterized protein n=1 Tax=Geobacillus proteiniphilus TaxID=860353 RepID=A0A1Q5T744_9BACL|nr:hypothetical protein BRO54_0684 [Geobacillus proteiniphilus]
MERRAGAKVGRLSPQAALTFYIGAFFGSLIGKFKFFVDGDKKSAAWAPDSFTGCSIVSV